MSAKQNKKNQPDPDSIDNAIQKTLQIENKIGELTDELDELAHHFRRHPQTYRLFKAASSLDEASDQLDCWLTHTPTDSCE